MTLLAQDLVYAWRTLRKSPVFTTVAVATLALGIGANTAIFTLIQAVLLRPLPFPNPDRLCLVWEDTTMFGAKDSPVAMGNYTEWRARNRVFQHMGALEQGAFRLTGAGEAQQVRGSLVTAGLFETLGVAPALGRPFREDEDQPGTPKTVILSDGLWRSEFGGDPAVVGRPVQIEDDKFTIAGVMPPGFRFPDAGTELWVPAGAFYKPGDLSNRGRHNAMVVARLKPGISLARANEDIGAIARTLEREYPDTNARVGAFVAPLRDHFVADLRTILMVLAGAVGFVLLIACANIANLLLSRASNRTREVAIRAAVGASRWHVARQLMTENLLLASAGGAAGLLVAVWGVRFLDKMMPAGIGAMTAVTVDVPVLAFTLGVSLATGIVFGTVPALQMLRVDLHQTLKQGGSKGTSARFRGVERGLVVAEVGLAFVLALSAALFLQSFARLRGVDPGFRAAGILTMRTPISARQYSDPAKRAAYYDQVLGRVAALPGVTSAGFTNGLPLVLKGNVNGLQVEGQPALGGDVFSNANYRVVTPDYLRTIGVPLRDGRHLDRRDTVGAPRVAVINEAMKRKFWRDGSALGKRFRFGDRAPWTTVVGVAGDILQGGLDRPPKPEMYLPAAQEPAAAICLAVRTTGDPRGLAAAVRREIRAVDKSVPILEVRTMEEVLDREVFQRRVQMVLLQIFAGVALLLAALGIYGVLACLVAQRTREIGIRMALGARPADVLWTVAGQGVGLSVAGVAAGAAAAMALTRVLSKLLFGIAATDPATFAAVGALLIAVAAAASYVPARRAMRVDPILALREE